MQFDDNLTNPALGWKKTQYIMNNLRNKVQLIGNLGDNPEITNLENGKKIAKFSLATNETYINNKGEKITQTQWHSLIAWNKTADIIEKYVFKGSEITIEGKLTNRSWEDKEGNKRYATEVLVNEILLMGKNPNVGSAITKKEDDLPF
jgi:single-strand DNA-binding protein